MKPSGWTSSRYTSHHTPGSGTHCDRVCSPRNIFVHWGVPKEINMGCSVYFFSDLSCNLLQCQIHFLPPGLSLETKERQKSDGGRQRLSVRSSVRYQTWYTTSCLRRTNKTKNWQKLGISNCWPSENINQRSVMPRPLKIPNYSYKGGLVKAMWGHRVI